MFANEITKKWVDLGILDGIEEYDQKDILAQCYEDMADYMLGLPDDEVNKEPLNRLTLVIFPILRLAHINTNYLYEIDTVKVVDFCIDSLKTNGEIKELMFTDIHSSWVSIDYEAEAIHMLSELVTIELQNGRLL